MKKKAVPEEMLTKAEERLANLPENHGGMNHREYAEKYGIDLQVSDWERKTAKTILAAIKLTKNYSEFSECIYQGFKEAIQVEIESAEQRGRDMAVDYFLDRYLEDDKLFPHIAAARKLIEAARSPEEESSSGSTKRVV